MAKLDLLNQPGPQYKSLWWILLSYGIRPEVVFGLSSGPIAVNCISEPLVKKEIMQTMFL